LGRGRLAQLAAVAHGSGGEGARGRGGEGAAVQLQLAIYIVYWKLAAVLALVLVPARRARRVNANHSRGGFRARHGLFLARLETLIDVTRRTLRDVYRRYSTHAYRRL